MFCIFLSFRYLPKLKLTWDFCRVNIYHEIHLEIKKSTRGGLGAKWDQVARAPGHANQARLSLGPPMSCIFASKCLAWPKNAYIKIPLTIAIERQQKNTKHKNRGCSSKDWWWKHCWSCPRSLLHPLQHQHHHHRHDEGVVHLWTMGFWKQLVLFISYTSLFRHHMSCPTWLWCMLCNSYVVDLYIIGWLMRCNMLLCSWYMSRCIFLPHSLLLVLIQHVCEGMRDMMCIGEVTRY
jgi:hypothetical protein